VNTVIATVLDIVKTPAILVALMAMLGLILQRKSVSEVIRGSLKTFVGFLVLVGGAGVVSNSLEPFGAMFQQAFHLDGVVANNEAVVSLALIEYGAATAMIMFVGMVVNMLIAAVTKFKHIFLTGHHTLYMAAMLSVIFTVAGFHGPGLIIVGGLALGAIMSLSPFFLQPFMRTMTGHDGVGLGHFGGGGYWLAGAIGHLVRGRKE
jgi:PTS system ascorbate-specific IIC component